MHVLPQRESLVHQVAEIVRQGIADGVWTEHLPGELELCRKFQVSRATLRAAMELLTKERLVSSSQGQRRQVLNGATGPLVAQARTVRLLTAVPLESMGGGSMLLVDHLREQLAKDHVELELHVSAACFSRKPDKALLTQSRGKAAAVWVVMSAPASTQDWFMQRGLPCVLVGSPHEGVVLPSLDADFDEMGQHAARQFLSRGHRRLAVVIPKMEKAGDARTVAAFRAVCEQTPGARVRMIEHDSTPEGIQSSLSAALKTSPPTGLLIAHPRHVLTVMSYLTSLGLRVPRDMSILSRDSEPFLDFMVPTPARYVVAPDTFARRLSHLVLKMARGEPVPASAQLLMPRFVAGETLGRLPGQQTSGH